MELFGGRAVQDDRIEVVRFEDLVADTPAFLERLCSFLELSFEPDMTLDLTSKQLGGRMGNPTTDRAYSEVSREPLDK